MDYIMGNIFHKRGIRKKWRFFGIIGEGSKSQKEEQSPRIMDLSVILFIIFLKNIFKHHNSRY